MIRRLVRRLWLSLVVLLLLLALAFSAARLLLPLASYYRVELVEALSRHLGVPLAVEHIEARWYGWGPRLGFHGLTLYESGSERPLLSLDEAVVQLDLLPSLRRGVPQFSRLTLRGLRLAMIRRQDGSIQLLGGTAGQMLDARQLLSWLQARRTLALEDGALDLHDERHPGEVWHFRDLALYLSNEGALHRLQVQMALEGEGEAQRLQIGALVRGDLREMVHLPADGEATGGGEARLHLALTGLDVTRLPWPLRWREWELRQGRLDLQLWGVWNRNHLQRLEGRAQLQGPGLSRDGQDVRPLPWRRLGGDFLWQRTAAGWRLDATRLRLVSARGAWPQTALHLLQEEGRWTGRLALADVTDVVETASWWAGVRSAEVSSGAAPDTWAALLDDLVSRHPRGILRDLYFHVRVPATRDAGWRYWVGGSFTGLGWEAASQAEGSDDGPALVLASISASIPASIPGVQGLDGRFVMNEAEGVLELTAGEALALPALFRGPLRAQTLAGKWYWRREAQDGGWRLQGRELRWTDPALRLQGELDLELPSTADTPPQLDLALTFSAATLEPLARYLPAGVMRPGLVRWLERAIVAGRIPGGELLFRGPLQAAAFGTATQLEIRFTVLDGILDYARGWPRLEEIEAGLRFRNRRLEIELASASSLTSAVESAAIVIADMTARPAMLDISGTARGPTGDVLRFLRESPLRHRFGHYLEGLQAFGRSRLELTVRKPLAAGSGAEVGGRLLFTNSLLAVGGQPPLEIQGLAGALRFSNAGLFADDLSGKILGMPARLRVDTLPAAGGARGSVTRIEARGWIGARRLAELVPVPLFRYTNGATDWRAELILPAADPVAPPSAPRLVIRSDLRGLGLLLPPPLFKPPDETRFLTLETRLPRSQDAPLRIRLGERLQALLDMDEALRLERGEILLGQGRPRLPEHDGLRLRGRVEALSLSAWHPYLQAEPQPVFPVEAPPSPSDRQTAGGGPAPLRSLDLGVGRLEVLGQDFHQARVRARLKDRVWSIDADSEELRGYIEYPLDHRLPIIMELDHLYLRARPAGEDGQGEAAEPAQSFDPRDVPPLVVHSKAFRYRDTDLGALVLRSSKHAAGMRFDELRLDGGLLRLQMHGTWMVVGGTAQRSVFNIVLETRNLGRVLAFLGYGRTIKKGRAYIELAGQWPGDPTAFALERFSGIASLRVRDGRLLDVDPGAGRLFGLLNLQALPRRLTLDFSDVFDKGFTFDEIDGTFVVRRGVASTEDLILKGPAATIEVKGRIDMGARQYDQRVVVVPHLTSSLPVAGMVAGGLGVGAAILLFEQVFKHEIAKVTRITYKVTGSWDDPRVERMVE